MAEVAGLLLAAGRGRRAGGPKALRRGGDGVPWVRRSVAVLREGGCASVHVVVGAAAEEVGALLDESVHVVRAADWAEGMGASLRAGLRALAVSPAPAACVHLVDLPDVGPEVIRRLLAYTAPDALARASYADGPGHPVLIGRTHWAGVVAAAAGDEGARSYLAGRPVREVDCSDLAAGGDVDGPVGGRTGSAPPAAPV